MYVQTISQLFARTTTLVRMAERSRGVEKKNTKAEKRKGWKMRGNSRHQIHRTQWP